jgi:hypothetical protein
MIDLDLPDSMLGISLDALVAVTLKIFLANMAGLYETHKQILIFSTIGNAFIELIS